MLYISKKSAAVVATSMFATTMMAGCGEKNESSTICSSHTVQDDCEDDAACAWDGDAGTCGDAPAPTPGPVCGDNENQTDCEANSCKWVTSDPSQDPFCIEQKKVFLVIDVLDGYDHGFLSDDHGVVVGSSLVKEDGSDVEKQFLGAETPGSVAYLEQPQTFTDVKAFAWSPELKTSVLENHSLPADTEYTHYDSVSISLDKGWNKGITGSRLQSASERIVQEIQRKGATNSTSYYDNVVFVHDFLPGKDAFEAGDVQGGNLVYVGDSQELDVTVGSTQEAILDLVNADNNIMNKDITATSTDGPEVEEKTWTPVSEDTVWTSVAAIQTLGGVDILLPYTDQNQITVDSLGKDINQRIRDLLPEVSIFNEPAVTADSPASTPETDQLILDGSVSVFYHRKQVDNAFDTSIASWLTNSPDALGAVDVTDEGLAWPNAQSLEQKLRARGCHPENCALSMSGILTEYCVKYTLITATWLNYYVNLIDDATQSASDEDKASGLASYDVPEDGIPDDKTEKDYAQPGFWKLVSGPLSEEVDTDTDKVDVDIDDASTVDTDVEEKL